MTRSEDERNNMKKQKVAVYVASMLVLGSHAVGYAEGDSHFVESGQVTGEKSVAIVSTASVNGTSAIAIGDASKVEANHAVAIGKESKASGESSVAIGDQSESIGINSLSLGKEAKANGESSVAIGTQSKSVGPNSLAFGKEAKANGESSVAIGPQSESIGTNSLAFGKEAKATGESTAAIGKGSKATGASTIAIGTQSESVGTNSLAIGKESKGTGESTVAIGLQSESTGTNSIAIGKETKATVDGAVAIGANSIADRSGKTASYIGYNPMSNTHYKYGEAGADNPKLEALYEKIRQANYKVLQAEEDVKRAEASKDAAVIATANTQKAKVDQDLVDAEKAYAAAIEEANKAGNDAISSAWNATDGAVSVGGIKDGKQHTRQITNVAAGFEDTDAATVGQLRVLRNRLEREKPRYISIKSRDLGVDSNELNNTATKEGAIAIGPRAKSESENAIAIGRNVQIGQNSKNTVAIGIGIDKTGTRSVNIGEGTSTLGENSTAVGQGAKAGDSALAIGGSARAESKNSVAVGRAATIGASALGATALGDSANSDESQSVSVGYSAHAYQFGSIAVGAHTETHGNGSIAIGHNSKVGESGNQAYAGISIGMDSKTVVRNGVALGTGSYADRDANSTSNRGYDPSLHGSHFADAAAEAAVPSLERSIWKATDSAVSVGNGRSGYRKTRQIINVAAGGEDTDAVNVAQLKALEKRNTILAGNDVPFKADGSVSDATPDTRVYTPGDKEIKIQGKANTVYGVAPQAGAKAPDGKSEYAAPTLYSSDNLITYKDPTDSILRIGMLNTPTFTGVNFAHPTMNITLGGNDRGQLTLTTGGKGDGATSTTSPVLTAASLKDVLKAEKGIKITEKDEGEYGKTYTFSLNKDELKGDPDFKGDKGDPGAKGDQGEKGEKGETGAKGDTGADGKSAFEVWSKMPGNENKTQEDFIKAITGANGKDGAVGPQGPQGENGTDGKSAYEVWKEIPGNGEKTKEEYLASLKGERGETGPQGIAGPKGDKGETGAVGPKGDPGKQGKVGPKGEAGAVGKSAFEVWSKMPGNENKTQDDFIKAITGANGKDGAAGPQGPQGENGTDGKSAYEVWKEIPGNGEKTKEEYLAALKGERGETGPQGIAGPKGETGATGKDGAQGPKGDTGAAGPKGDKGDAGVAGPKGNTGKSAYEYWKEIKGNENKTEDDFRKALEGGTKVNTHEYEKLEHQIGELGNDLQELRKESRNGDALGAALSALKPIQYDPLEPTQFMAGVGHYKNANAVALGIAHYTKESTMFHAGVSMVRGATMINGGATFKFGNSPEKKAVPERYRNGPISSVLVLHDEMVAMKEAYGREITVLTQENNNLRQDIAALQEQMQELRAMVRK